MPMMSSWRSLKIALALCCLTGIATSVYLKHWTAITWVLATWATGWLACKSAMQLREEQTKD